MLLHSHLLDSTRVGLSRRPPVDVVVALERPPAAAPRRAGPSSLPHLLLLIVVFLLSVRFAAAAAAAAAAACLLACGRPTGRPLMVVWCGGGRSVARSVALSVGGESKRVALSQCWPFCGKKQVASFAFARSAAPSELADGRMAQQHCVS